MKTLFRFIAFLLMSALPTVAANLALVKQAPASFSQLERDIQHELLLLPGYTVFDDIGFELKGTTVRLTGDVTRSRLKEAAEQAVRELPGVRRVVNNIEVLPSSSLDNQIRIAAFRAIYGEPAFRTYASQSVQPIRILVKDGCLTLEGAVANETDRKAAYMKALMVPGVLAVSNRLQVAS
ncbi:MAG TPA: BON domain-containing protein [Bryobacteraceae bacterium]|jgi:hyperosmotically inducible protein|nr:BON domain-containing protein [Bryobacteraceae bacterium]